MQKTNNSRPSYVLKEFDRPLYLANHFGFIPVECPRVSDIDLNVTDDCRRDEDADSTLHDAAEKAAFLRTYTERDFASLYHPLQVAYRRSEPGKRAYDHALHILGFPGAMAEAILIRSALSILGDRGHEHMVVEVNSIGDKDSIQGYERELHTYVRKIASDILPEDKKRIKEDIFRILELALPDPVKEKLPLSIASLNAPSRIHFKEMLECLEYLGADFRLAHTLVGNRTYNSHTIFAIRDADDESVLAEGGRYSRLSRRIGFKKELPAASITIFANHRFEPKEIHKKMYKDLPKPKFYLVQLGREAKMKALPLIELLRVHKIPVYSYLGRDKITIQLSSADTLRVPYLLIVGQKEALDNTVTVRNVSTRAQDTIHMNALPEYLKNIAL